MTDIKALEQAQPEDPDLPEQEAEACPVDAETGRITDDEITEA